MDVSERNARELQFRTRFSIFFVEIDSQRALVHSRVEKNTRESPKKHQKLSTNRFITKKRLRQLTNVIT